MTAALVGGATVITGAAVTLPPPPPPPPAGAPFPVPLPATATVAAPVVAAPEHASLVGPTVIVVVSVALNPKTDTPPVQVFVAMNPCPFVPMTLPVADVTWIDEPLLSVTWKLLAPTVIVFKDDVAPDTVRLIPLTVMTVSTTMVTSSKAAWVVRGRLTVTANIAKTSRSKNVDVVDARSFFMSVRYELIMGYLLSEPPRS